MTSYHTLAPAELDAIASGEPDAPVIEALLSGQYSKRLVMIRAILAAAADRRLGGRDRLEKAYGLLAAAQQADPGTVRAILTHPSTGLWAVRCLTGLQSSSADPASLATDLSQLAAFAAAAAIRAGQAFAIEVPVRDRAVMLPTLGLARLGSASSEPGTTVAADCPAFAIVAHDGHQVTITAGRSAVTLPADPSQDGAGWQGLRSLRACHCGVPISSEFNDLDPDQDADGVSLAGRQDGDAMAAWQSALDGAWVTLARHHPRRARAIAAGLKSITPLIPPSKNAQVSVTSTGGTGGLLLTLPKDPLSFAETLVHEFQHSVLTAVTDISRLHTTDPDEVYYAPWREDPRPIGGLFQGTYSYLGVAGYWEAQRKAMTGGQRALADFEFARWRDQVRATAMTLLGSGKLTETGTMIARRMAVTAERWCGLSVAEEPRRLAERAVTDHATRWRLRHWQPDQASINAIVLAWRHQRSCPGRPDEIPVTILPRRWRPPLGMRTRLLRLRLADPDQFRQRCADPDVSEADLAYVTDDFERAAKAYRLAIQAKPEDIEPWAGLALATAELHGSATRSTIPPEITRSAYLMIRELSGTEPNLGELKEWMGDTRAVDSP
jgi:HEXXH motif-containing protein